jgi:MSHA pilin protein MshA
MRSILSARLSFPQSKGFSLIESVVLVSLVGIVTVFAVPRYTRLANAARASEVTALGAKLRKAAQLAHAQYVESGARAGSAIIRGKLVRLKNGYPEASSAGIGNALFETEGFTAETTEDSVTFLNPDAPSAKACSVAYQTAPTPSAVPSVTNVETSGC